MAVRTLLSYVCVLLLYGTIVAEEAATPKVKSIKAKNIAPADPAAQVEETKNSIETQRAAIKNLAEALLAQSNAAKALEEAEKNAAAANSDEAKLTATKQVEAAKSTLAEATKAAEKRREELRKATPAQPNVVRGGYPSVASVAVRDDVDPQDPTERFALLLPGGPVVVEAAMTIDGQPFRVAREKLIGELLDSLAKDKDGKATWEEALKNGKFTQGRIQVANDDQRTAYIKMLDKNANGQVDRAEVRLFVAQYFQGPAFVLGAGYSYGGNFGGGGVVLVNGQPLYRGGGQVDVQKLLDADDDGVLDEKEIASAGERLKSRDSDDNDLLEPNEITSGAATGNTQVRLIGQQPQVQTQLSVLLGPTAKAELLFQALQQRYKNGAGQVTAASFAAVPKLFEMLDKNHDGNLETDEVLALNTIEPHVKLAVDLGTTKDAKGLTLTSLTPELIKSKASRETLSVDLPGVKLSLSANLNAPQNYNYEQMANSYLTRYDKDSNGYLDKDELAGNLARMMEMWDGDNDGKVYVKEITESYARSLAPQQSQIRANVASLGNSLFEALDQSGDGRLSLREMRTAHERIKTFDADQDNRITQDEIPVTVSVTFALGNAGYSYGRTVPGAGSGAGNNRSAASDAPEWFTRMDRNGDGDVTLKEFLGGPDQFKKLDANGDGFIELKEAKAATPSKE